MKYFDKILFVLLCILYFTYYGILNVALYLGLPNSEISGGMRLFIISGAALLLLRDFFVRKDFPRLTIHSWCFFIFFTVFFVKILMENPIVLYLYNQSIPLFLYVTYICYFGAFFLYFAGRERFFYILNSPKIIYWGGVLGCALILYTNRDALSSFRLTDSDNEVNRCLVKYPMAMLYIISLYFLIFTPPIFNKILGVIGVAISGSNLLMSDSKSSIISFAFILFSYMLLSLKRIKIFITALIVSLSFLVISTPYLLSSTAWERLAALQDYETMDLQGDAELSRYYLLLRGWDLFLESPVYGGSIFDVEIHSSHFLPVEILRHEGVIGAILIIIAFWGMFKGGIYIFKSDPKYFWVFGILAWDISQQIFHGYSYTLPSVSAAIFLMAANLAAEDKRRGFLPRR